MSCVIIHEGYLFKTPPLDKFFMSWKKRWFVLSRLNPHDPSSLDLCYYKDASKKDKSTSIDIRKIKSINPVYNKAKENVFSLEMVDSKFVLRAADKQEKALWVAKLLECCSKDGSAYHVTVPDQPAASFSEGILKTSTPLKVSVISSFNGNAVLTIPFDSIRRFGCQLAIDKDIIWFETCGCKGEVEEFQFFIVALGIEKAYQIVQEYKRSIELALRDHMIMEEGDQSQFLYSYVVKSHYGHSDFPVVQRERILQSSILSLSTSGGSLSLSELNKFTRSRPSFPAINPQASVDMRAGPYSPGRNMTPPSPGSPQHGPYEHGSQKMTLTQLQRSPRPARTSLQQSSAPPTGYDSGVIVDGPIDPSRHSAPCYVDGSQRSMPARPDLSQTKGKSFDGVRKTSSGTRPTLQDFRGAGKGPDEVKKLNMSLGQMQLKGGIQAFNSQRKGTDSAVGSASDLNHTPYSRAGYGYSGSPGKSPYHHLSGNGVHSNGGYAYDHLAENVRVTPPTLHTERGPPS